MEINKREYELMKQYVDGDLKVSDLIAKIVELEESQNEMKMLHNIKPAYEVKVCVFPNTSAANAVLTHMIDSADRYESVSVSEYYELIDIRPIYVDDKYGWSAESIKNAKIGFSLPHSGYVIKFPPVEVL